VASDCRQMCFDINRFLLLCFRTHDPTRKPLSDFGGR
jgi:hypothetical protein